MKGRYDGPMSTHDDHATLIDSLERIALVRKLAAAVRGCVPPRVYGVHGDWGAGKTSFLHQLHRTLDGLPAREEWVNRQNTEHARMNGDHQSGNHPCACEVPVYTSGDTDDPLVVWFEAWRYQHEASPVVALLHEMRGQLGHLARLRGAALKLGEVTIRSALMQLEQIAKFAWLQSGDSVSVRGSQGGLVSTIQTEGERWEREHLAEKLPAEAIREQLEHAVNLLLGRQPTDDPGKGRRVVVLIDDLDRCEAQATFRLLEGIKIYLNIPNCVFVLGMDQRIIEDAIAETAPGAKDDTKVAHRRAREYLEKLFQEVYHLPIVQDAPTKFMAWLPRGTTKVSKTTRDELGGVLAAYPECLPANPRKLKAFAAVVWRFLTEAPVGAASFPDFETIPEHTEDAARRRYLSLVLILAALYHFHPKVYRILEAHPERFYPMLYAWCANETIDAAPDHPCLQNIEREGRPKGPSSVGANTLQEWISSLPDPSRGDVLRVQRLIYHARPYQKASIQSLLLK